MAEGRSSAVAGESTYLGALVCGNCGVARAGAPDKADWTIVVAGGALREVVCPQCEAGVELEISEHAIVRFHERVRPTLSIAQAEQELIRQLAAHGYWATPDWLSPAELGDDKWLMIGNDIGFPVRRDRVVSCFVRSTLNPRMRRIVSDVNSFHKRANRAKERPNRRKYLGREAKRNRRRDKSWRDEERGTAA